MDKPICIGNCRISKQDRPYFIADIAANHDGDIKRAFALIELAKESGADIAKFQNFKAEKIVSDYGFRHLEGQLSHQKSWKKSVFEVYQDAQLSDEWTPLLKEKCDAVGIEYMTSPYDFESVDWADPYVNAYKVGSGDISWRRFLKYVADKRKPMLLATGAADMTEVEAAVQTILDENVPLILMQCNTNYTANRVNYSSINLNVLRTYAEKWSELILGLSDHTKGYTMVLGAIALGARVIEKHFTDDNNRQGPDHLFSTTPTEWRAMVDAATDLYHGLGDGIKRIEANENETCLVQKRGLYITHTLTVGDRLSADDLIALRPRSEAGFEPWELESLVGRTVHRSIETGEMLKRDDVR